MYIRMQSLITKPMLTIPARQLRPRKVKALPEMIADPGLQESIRIFGKITTLSIGFYCGLQYFYYKELRKKVEDEKKDDN